MTKEEKELLLKDLCCRLSYGVHIHTDHYEEKVLEPYYLDQFDVLNPKPYLRPMSSISGAECILFRETTGLRIDKTEVIHPKTGKPVSYVSITNDYSDNPDTSSLVEIDGSVIYKAMDFLNAHHLDYRNLIGKGLALEAPEGMYK